MSTNAQLEVARPASLGALGLERMPTEAHFRRDHFGIPDVPPSPWTLVVRGEVEYELRLSEADLRGLGERRLDAVLECAGHRRTDFTPHVGGIQWTVGAVSEAEWRGARLADVLSKAKPRGRYAVLEGTDRGAYDGESVAFARAIPIDKALHPDTLVAWGMNGGALPREHGGPLRAVVPGWYATDSVKWLHCITVVTEPYAGPFEAKEYRLSRDGQIAERLTSLPIHSLVTSLADHDRVSRGAQLLTGIAWGGDGVSRVEVAIDQGVWRAATLDERRTRYGRRRWSLEWSAVPGLHTIAVRATDGHGRTQPDALTWNAGGYANASVQRLGVVAD